MWSDRRFAKGETVALELAGACRRYTAGLAQTLQLGAKPPKVADVENAVLEGMDAVLGAMAPGVLARDVEATWCGAIGRHGLRKESRIGYSIGVAYPPDWGEHTIGLRQGDRTVLEPGHVLRHVDGWLGHRAPGKSARHARRDDRGG